MEDDGTNIFGIIMDLQSEPGDKPEIMCSSLSQQKSVSVIMSQGDHTFRALKRSGFSVELTLRRSPEPGTTT